MSTPDPVPTPSTPAAPAPTAAQLASSAVNAQLVSQLLGMQAQIESEIDYLGNAAANLADRQAKLAAVQAQLTALGYVAPTGP